MFTDQLVELGVVEHFQAPQIVDGDLLGVELPLIDPAQESQRPAGPAEEDLAADPLQLVAEPRVLGQNLGRDTIVVKTRHGPQRRDLNVVLLFDQQPPQQVRHARRIAHLAQSLDQRHPRGRGHLRIGDQLPDPLLGGLTAAGHGQPQQVRIAGLGRVAQRG